MSFDPRQPPRRCPLLPFKQLMRPMRSSGSPGAAENHFLHLPAQDLFQNNHLRTNGQSKCNTIEKHLLTECPAQCLCVCSFILHEFIKYLVKVFGFCGVCAAAEGLLLHQ